MTNNQWDDNKLENLLHSMPKIEDNRSKEQIIERLKQDQRLKKPRRMNPKKWTPVLVAAAAILLLSLIVPSMLNKNNGAMEDSGSQRAYKAERAIDSSTENETMEEAGDTFGTSSTNEAALTFATVESHVLLADELHGMQPFQIGLVESANVIPITFLIPESEVRSDFPEGNPNSIEMYNMYAKEILEKELGFEEYHPFKGSLYVENGIIHHQIPADHSYDLSSSTVDVYNNSMKETFPEFEKLQLVDEKGNPKSFESVGKSNAFELKRSFPYYRYTMPSGKVYLAPYEPAVSVDNVAEGLIAMKEANGDTVETLIPEKVDYDVEIEDDVAVIAFKEQLDTNSFDQNELNQMIEGFMLTAKNYGKQVKLNNVVQENFGKYNLSTALPMPIGSNPTMFNR